MAGDNKEGRPLKFESVEDLQESIDEYFASIEYFYEEEMKFKGKKMTIEKVGYKEPATVTGLALHLDTTRRTLLDYEYRDDEYSHAIKKAKVKIEKLIEQKLFSGYSTGSIFNLKNNFGWVDKTEVNQNLFGELKTISTSELPSGRELIRAIKKKNKETTV